MKLPNFLIIGAQKSGTAWLKANLKTHPDIFMTNREVHFFNTDVHFNKGLQWYALQFQGVRNETFIGEKSPGYLYYDIARIRIQKLFPHMKLIAVLRDPIKRAISSVNHHKKAGRIHPSLKLDRILMGIISGDKKYMQLENRYQFIDRGKYYTQLQRYYEHFNPDHLLILIFEEDVVRNPMDGLKKTCDFLGTNSNLIDSQKIDTKVNKNKATKTRLLLDYYFPRHKKLNSRISKFFPTNTPDNSISRETLSALVDIYSRENENLFTLLGFKPVDWLTKENYLE